MTMNHLTPEELSKEFGLDRQEVIRVCVEEGVPIYQGKIDKHLFQTQLQALRQRTPSTYVLIDRASRNILAECETFAEAEAVLLDYVGTYPQAAHDLEIVGPGGIRKRMSPIKLRDRTDCDDVATNGVREEP